MSAKQKKSWNEKLHDSKDLPKVEKMTGRMAEKFGKGTLVIPAPPEVDEFMKKIPKGKLSTINHIREALATRHHATIACPMTTGIFAWIAANASEEAKACGVKRVTPYWRTLKSDGSLNDKYPEGAEVQAQHLLDEGIGIDFKNPEKPKVKNFEKYLFPTRRYANP